MANQVYRGVNIYDRREEGTESGPLGPRLRWYTVSPSAAANTLAGIKSLIRMKQTPLRLYGHTVGGQ